MYAKSTINVTFFTDTYNENTEKVVYGRVSESVKTGKKGEDGKDIYEYENWNARFVGKAKDKAAALTDKTPIVLKEWSARVNYNKEKKQSYPYLMVMDFDVKTKDQ